MDEADMQKLKSVEAVLEPAVKGLPQLGSGEVLDELAARSIVSIAASLKRQADALEGIRRVLLSKVSS